MLGGALTMFTFADSRLPFRARQGFCRAWGPSHTARLPALTRRGWAPKLRIGRLDAYGSPAHRVHRMRR